MPPPEPSEPRGKAVPRARVRDGRASATQPGAGRADPYARRRGVSDERTFARQRRAPGRHRRLGDGALASLLLQMGKRVTGSDVVAHATIRAICAPGAPSSVAAMPRRTSKRRRLRGALVGECPTTTSEVVEAKRRGVPSRKLAEAVGELMRDRRAWPSPAPTARRRPRRWWRGCWTGAASIRWS